MTSRGAPSNEWTARQPVRVNVERLASHAEKFAQAEGDVQAGRAGEAPGERDAEPVPCAHCLELEQQVVTLRRTAERLSKQLVASSSRLVSEVARARAEGREEGRAAKREGTGW